MHPGTRRSTWLRVGVPLLLAKGLLLLFALVAFHLLPPDFFLERAYYANFHWPPGEPPTVASAFKTWDGQHYLYLSEHGYRPGISSNAFYPLWPLVIRLGALALPGGSLAAALVLANLLSAAALVLLHELVHEEFGDPAAADATVLLLFAYPGAPFLLLPFTESLFLLLSVLFFRFLQHGRLPAAAGVAFLLPLTKGVGCIIALPLAFVLWRRWRDTPAARGPSDAAAGLAMLSAPALGFGSYLLMMHCTAGNALAGVEIQAGFIGERSLLKVLDLKLLVTNLLDVGSVHGFLDSAVDRLCFLVLLACLVPIWRVSRVWFLFCLGMGVFPVLTGSFQSFLRFLVVVFPVFVVLGRSLSRPSAAGLRRAVIALLFALQLVFLVLQTNNFWVG